jgi:hypothetical protein
VAGETSCRYFIDRLILDGIVLVFLGSVVDQPTLLERLSAAPMALKLRGDTDLPDILSASVRRLPAAQYRCTGHTSSPIPQLRSFPKLRELAPLPMHRTYFEP